MKRPDLQVDDSETIVRLLSSYWVIGNEILHVAFTLRDRETYISVNRPSISSYNTDVKNFLESHPDFYSDKEQKEYKQAALNVAEIRNIRIDVDDLLLNMEVEVEPITQNQRSHAGIFTRLNGKNLKTGDLIFDNTLKTGVSADVILLEVRSRLLELSHLEILQQPRRDKK